MNFNMKKILNILLNSFLFYFYFIYIKMNDICKLYIYSFVILSTLYIAIIFIHKRYKKKYIILTILIFILVSIKI